MRNFSESLCLESERRGIIVQVFELKTEFSYFHFLPFSFRLSYPVLYPVVIADLHYLLRHRRRMSVMLWLHWEWLTLHVDTGLIPYK